MMNEEQVKDVESQATSQVEPTVLESVAREAAQWIESFGKNVADVLHDASDMMLVTVDEETREHLDMLVEAGIAKNRREAASALLQQGLKSRGNLEAKIADTNARISELRQQLRTLAGNAS